MATFGTERSRHDHVPRTDSAPAHIAPADLHRPDPARVRGSHRRDRRGRPTHGTSTGTFSSGLKGSGVGATQVRTVPAFTAVDLAGSNNVTVHVGDTQTVTVHGDDNLIRYVTTTVQGGTLAVGQSRDFSTTSPMSVEITVPALDAATLSGAGVLTATGVAADHFTVRAPGSGVLVVTGTATTLDATLAGTGDIRLDGLAAPHATASVPGTGRLLELMRAATVSTPPSRASARSSTPATLPTSPRASPAPARSRGARG